MSAVRKAAPRKRSGTVAPVLSEKRFQLQVEQLARLRGFVVWHDADSRRNAAGFPDLLLIRPDRGVLWAELKTEKGVLRPAQAAFLDALRAAGQTVFVWRPSSWPEILKVLM